GASDEVCDNIDNDCDGTVDEELTRPTTCGTGACEGNSGSETCAAGVWGDDTCDPLSGASDEVCDNIDNDCDGEIDEGFLDENLYRDADNDGFGDPGNSILGCLRPGYVTNNNDFDDTDANSYPGAPELCDCIDNNNNGQADEGCQNNAPTVPVFYAIEPSQNSNETTSQQPTIIINNSSDINNTINNDCQTITYEIEIYSEVALTSRVNFISELAEGEGTTSWRVDDTLSDNVFYYMRARAFDGINYSGWMETIPFFINTANDPPSVPTHSWPPDLSEVTNLQPVLKINNAADIDFDPLTYQFEVYSDPTMATLYSTAEEIEEGADGTTSWRIDSPLEDHTHYWWRVQAKDNEGIMSEWTDLFQFFVNMANGSPSVPSIYSPYDGEEVGDLIPELTVNNSTDPDLDILTYFLEIDKVNTFDSPLCERSPEVSEGTNGTTSWKPTELVDNTMYYWRANAYDGDAYSEWIISSLFVNLFNDAPSAPTINNPGNNSVVNTVRPTLIINPSTDVDLDQMTYKFELYSDDALTDLVTSANSTECSWRINMVVANNQHYYWRAQAVDEHGLASEWSSVASFYVNSSGVEVIPYASQDILADALSLQIINVTVEESPIRGVSVEIQPDALINDVTITIGEAINTPPFPNNIRAIGRVIDFGPTGTNFAIPVTIKIPYTEEDLNNAGISDPSEFKVFTYNTLAFTWELLTIYDIDKVNKLLLCKVDHFSLYVMGVSIPQGEDAKDDKGSSACFIKVI
ncbi:MAG: MopE-related protein, partial [bacterium]